MSNKLIEVAASPAASAPPVSIAGLSFAGLPLNEWVYIGTLVWLAVQVGCKLYDTYRKHKDKQ